MVRDTAGEIYAKKAPSQIHCGPESYQVSGRRAGGGAVGNCTCTSDRCPGECSREQSLHIPFSEECHCLMYRMESPKTPRALQKQMGLVSSDIYWVFSSLPPFSGMTKVFLLST